MTFKIGYKHVSQYSSTPAGDEEFAIEAVLKLKLEEERTGDTPSLVHMRSLLSDKRNIFIVARDDEKPVGFAIAYSMPRIDRDQNMVYLYEIEVDREHRRHGIGTKMIDLLKRLCRERPVLKIWVGTEESNIPAQRLYEATGGKREPESVFEFVYSRKVF